MRRQRPQDKRFEEIDEHDSPTEPMAPVVLSPFSSPTPMVGWQGGEASRGATPEWAVTRPLRSIHVQPRRSPFPSFVGAFFVLVQVLLLTRFMLQLFAQPHSAKWVQIVYSASSIFVQPFLLLLRNVTLPAAVGKELYISLVILIAILIYGLLSRILVRFFKALLNSR